MSYCRFGWDDSNVYVIGTLSNGEPVIECCGCGLTGEMSFFHARDEAGMIAHLDEHRAKGDIVPEYVYERLREEMLAAAEEKR